MATIILGDIVEVIKETVHNPQESGFQYFVGLEHYDSGEPLITRYATPDNLTSSVKHFAKGDILVARRNVYLKRASLVDFEGVTSGDSIVLRAKDKKYQQILPFILNSDDFWDYAEQNSDGTMSKRLSPADLLDYEFEEPENIELLADKLWAAYRVKESYKKLLAATDDMLKAKFQEMFGEEGDKYSIKDLFELQMGKTPDRQNSLYWTQGKHKWFSIADMSKSNIYSKDTDEYISDLAVEKSGIKKVKKGTVFMSFKLTIGKVLIASEDVYTNEAIMAFNERYPYEAETGLRISKKWIYYTFLYKDWLENAAQAVKGRTLNKESIGNSNIIVPKYDLQQQFVEIATQAEATKESLRKSIENIDQVIKSLINQ